jgi:hypothetical protein
LKNIIFCWTYDEMNADLARAWCDEHGMVFQLAHHEDTLFPPEAGAIAIDLNHLAMEPSARVEFVQRLQSALLPYPVAVASYDLEAEMIDTLKAQGFLVFRRIERQMFYELAHMLGRGCKNVAVRLRDGRIRQRKVDLEGVKRRAPSAGQIYGRNLLQKFFSGTGVKRTQL